MASKCVRVGLNRGNNYAKTERPPPNGREKEQKQNVTVLERTENTSIIAIVLAAGTADAEMTHVLRTQSSKDFPLKPGVGHNTAMHASPTARNFFLELISTLPVHSPAICPKPLPCHPPKTKNQ